MAILRVPQAAKKVSYSRTNLMEVLGLGTDADVNREMLGAAAPEIQLVREMFAALADKRVHTNHAGAQWAWAILEASAEVPSFTATLRADLEAGRLPLPEELV